MAISTLALRLLAMGELKAVGQPLAAATLILFSNAIAPNKGTVIGDLVESTFDGYAPEAALVFGAAYLDSGGTPSLSAPSVQFESTSGTPAETIYGWALVNAGKTALYYAESLPLPVPISGASQGVVIQPTVRYGD